METENRRQQELLNELIERLLFLEQEIDTVYDFLYGKEESVNRVLNRTNTDIQTKLESFHKISKMGESIY